MKKIVFFIQNFSRSAGSERVTSLIADMLAKNGYDVTVLSICGDNTCYYPLDKRVKLFTLIQAEEVNNRKDFVKVYKALKAYYAQNKPDLVIDVFAALSIYTLLLKKKFKYANITWEHFNFKANVGLNKFGRKLAAKKSDVIVTLTQKDKQYYLEGLKRVKAKIVNIFNPSPYEINKINFEKRSNIILSVGRLTEQKAFDKMLYTWKNIQPKLSGWQLYIVGDGEKREELLNIIQKEDIQCVELMPATSNIADVYNSAKLYISTSLFEGLPMTMIEAQTFGLPIISYDYDTGPSDIISDGIDGLLANVGDEDNFMNDIVQLCNNSDKLKRMSECSYVSAERFNDSCIYKMWLDLIGDIL
jgi:glycosyltransferase involved in cell wall biosynthesis